MDVEELLEPWEYDEDSDLVIRVFLLLFLVLEVFLPLWLDESSLE